jgi:hypothetical protein
MVAFFLSFVVALILVGLLSAPLRSSSIRRLSYSSRSSIATAWNTASALVLRLVKAWDLSLGPKPPLSVTQVTVEQAEHSDRRPIGR